jgi:hypothetical protein
MWSQYMGREMERKGGFNVGIQYTALAQILPVAMRGNPAD